MSLDSPLVFNSISNFDVFWIEYIDFIFEVDLSQEISHTFNKITKQVILALANQALDTSFVDIFYHLL